MKEPKAKVVYRPVNTLNELEGNPRVIKKDQFEKLKESISKNEDFFEARPCILSDRTGKLVVIAGNQRLRAAKELGLKEIPTVLLTGLTEQREKEIIIRDNVENGEWDFDILANAWDEAQLQDWGVTGAMPKLDWADVDDLSDETYDQPEHECLKCPKCGHVDRKIHFKLVDAETENGAE